MAPVNGLYGVMNEDGVIGPYEAGELYGAAGVFLFVLAIGVYALVAVAAPVLSALPVGVWMTIWSLFRSTRTTAFSSTMARRSIIPAMPRR